MPKCNSSAIIIYTKILSFSFGKNVVQRKGIRFISDNKVKKVGALKEKNVCKYINTSHHRERLVKEEEEEEESVP